MEWVKCTVGDGWETLMLYVHVKALPIVQCGGAPEVIVKIEEL